MWEQDTQYVLNICAACCYGVILATRLKQWLPRVWLCNILNLWATTLNQGYFSRLPGGSQSASKQLWSNSDYLQWLSDQLETICKYYRLPKHSNQSVGTNVDNLSVTQLFATVDIRLDPGCILLICKVAVKSLSSSNYVIFCFWVFVSNL